MHKADFTDKALRRMHVDLLHEDVSPMALMRASIKEIADAWVSYNGPIPANFYRENTEKA